VASESEITVQPATPLPGLSARAADRVAHWPRDSRLAVIAALALWVVPMLVVSVAVAWNPEHRTVTASCHQATASWWSGQDIYVGPSGMNYLPHFAVLYTPFHLLPRRVGEVLWRLVAAASLAGGLWQLARVLFRSAPERPFFWATLVTMPLSMNALRNGNDNAIFGGVVMLAIVALLRERWWLASALMMLAIALKPLGIVLVLLAPLYYSRSLWWRLPLAVAVMAIFPFLFGRPAYVWSQYRAAWTNLQACAAVTQHRFADLNGILRTLGHPLEGRASTLVRVLAGGLAAAAWWWGARRLRSPLTGLWLLALATAYLMLFNPMNEENSYVILAPALGAWATYFLFSPDARDWRRLGWALVFMALSMGLLPNIVRPLFGNHFALFWHPVMAIIFVVMLGYFVQRSAPVDSGLRIQSA
jgi:hypothetical protein